MGCSNESEQRSTFRTSEINALEVGHVFSIYEPEDDFIVYAAAVGTTSDGDIILADSENSRLMAFDSNGEFIQQIGRDGSGPGEFTHIMDFVISLEGKIYVPDRRQARTSIFHKQGQEWVLDRVLTHTETGMFPIAVNENSAIFRAPLSQVPTPGVYEYKHWIAPATIESEIVLGTKLEVVEQVYLVNQVGSNFGLSAIPYAPKTLTMMDRQGNLHLLMLDETTIRVYDISMALKDSTQLRLEPVPTTVAERDTVIARRNPSMSSLISANFPSHKTLIEYFFVDEEGRYWLNTNDSPKYAVLDAHGNPLGSFDLPEGLTLLHVAQNRLYLTDFTSEQFSIEVYEARW